MKLTEQKVTIIQGAIGDMWPDNLNWLSPEDRAKEWKQHDKTVEKLKAEGEYLKPKELTIFIEEDRLLDGEPKSSTESYGFKILDLS